MEAVFVPISEFAPVFSLASEDGLDAWGVMYSHEWSTSTQYTLNGKVGRRFLPDLAGQTTSAIFTSIEDDQSEDALFLAGLCKTHEGCVLILDHPHGFSLEDMDHSVEATEQKLEATEKKLVQQKFNHPKKGDIIVKTMSEYATAYAIATIRGDPDATRWLIPPVSTFSLNLSPPLPTVRTSSSADVQQMDTDADPSELTKLG